jgi:hypothetical protein
MHRPPAVSWDVRSARWHAGALVFLLLVATLLLIGFVTTQGWGAFTTALLLVLVASALLALKGWYGTPVGQLNWDGEQWHWSGPDTHALNAVACVLDLQIRMLVRITGEQGTHHWLWLERRSPGASWVALRRALVASQRVSAPDPAQELPGNDHA